MDYNAFSGILGFALIAAGIIGFPHCIHHEDTVDEPEIGETILEEEIAIEQPAPLVLTPARTSLLIDYMMGFEKSKEYKRPLKTPEDKTSCDEMWGIVHVFNGYRYTLYYCDERFEVMDERGRFHTDQLAIYKIPAQMRWNDLSDERLDATVVPVGSIDGYVFADWYDENYRNTSYEECASEYYCEPPDWASDLSVYEQQAEWTQVNEELIAYYENGH